MPIETTTIRKGYLIHFISSDVVEKITETKNASSRIDGELKTEKYGFSDVKCDYSVDFIQTWRELGFLKIYKRL